MLKLTKRGDYGMMAMRYLAEHADDGRPHSARDIADAYNIPLPVLAKTLQRLARAESISSQLGRRHTFYFGLCELQHKLI